MSASNIDVTKLTRYLMLGGASAQIKVSKINRYLIVDPTGTGPAPPPRRRAHVRVTRKTVAS